MRTPENTPVDLAPLAAAALPVEAEGSWIRAAIARLADDRRHRDCVSEALTPVAPGC